MLNEEIPVNHNVKVGRNNIHYEITKVLKLWVRL